MKNLLFLFIAVILSNSLGYSQGYKTLEINELETVYLTNGDSLDISSITKQPLHGVYDVGFYDYYKDGKKCQLKDLIHVEKEEYRNHILLSFIDISSPYFTSFDLSTSSKTNKISSIEFSLTEVETKPIYYFAINFDENNRPFFWISNENTRNDKKYFQNHVIKEETYIGVSQKDSIYNYNGVKNSLTHEIKTIIKYNKKAQLKEITSYLIELDYEAERFEQGDETGFDAPKGKYVSGIIVTQGKYEELEDYPKHLIHMLFDKNGNLKFIHFYDKGKHLGTMKFNNDGAIILPFEW